MVSKLVNYGDPTQTLSSSAIPHQLLDKIDQVLSLAHTHNLPTVTPTQVLNHLDLAYQYGRLVPHTPALDEYGRAYKSYLNSLVEGEEDRMREELKKCEQLSGIHRNAQYLLQLAYKFVQKFVVKI